MIELKSAPKSGQIDLTGYVKPGQDALFEVDYFRQEKPKKSKPVGKLIDTKTEKLF